MRSGGDIELHDDVLPRYLSMAPIPLALERVLECKIHQQHEFRRPILDVGCGDGLLAGVLFNGRIDTGIDLSPNEIESARQRGRYDELIACPADAIPKPDASYRTVLSNSVLEHITNIEPVLREIHRLLADDGHLYVTVPSDRFDEYSVLNQLFRGIGLTAIAARYRRFFNSFWKHYHGYSLTRWRELAEGCGFEAVECYAFDPMRICLLNDALVPFSVIGFAAKVVANRWVLFPRLRRAVMTRVSPLAARILDGGERDDDGGLVYMNLVKAKHA